MQTIELQAMTVVQLRKLAKDHRVKLGAGIDKEGIIQKLTDALNGDEPSAAATEKVPEQIQMAEAAERSEPVDIEKAINAAELEKSANTAQTGETEESAASNADTDNAAGLLDTPLSADVTSIQPQSSYPSWNARPEEQEGYRPVYRQAWQARSAQNREPARPAWQQPQRQPGMVNRFGPQATVPLTPEPVMAQPDRGTPVPGYLDNSAQQTAISPSAPGAAPAPRLDGYRLGYRAAPQRSGYQSREGAQGAYQQNNYRQNNYNYRPNNGGYRPGGSYGGYQPQPSFPPQRSTDNHYNDAPYRVNRNPQFAEQAESGQIPEMLQLPEGEPAGGILEILPDGYGFLRSASLLPGKRDIYVSVAQIRRFDLRTGDFVEGKARAQRGNDKFAALLLVEKVNGSEAVESAERLQFDQLVPIYPNKRISLESVKERNNMLIRLVDLIAPIGFGQRAMIVTPPQSSGLVVLRDISRAIKENDADAQVLMLLIDVAPEEVTEIRETANAEVFASTFADAPEMQTRVSETMLERAQRMVESGRNVVILLDSLTKLTRAYQATLSQGGRPMSNTVTPAALIKPKRFFGAARNTREGGSLTVIATINVETGSRVDDIIFEEFKGTANMELFLLNPMQGDPISPMIDLQRSGTKKDDMLLSDERKESLRSIRKVLGSTTNGEAVVQLIDMMKKTKCNEDLLSRLQDWVALWEKSGYLKR